MKANPTLPVVPTEATAPGASPGPATAPADGTTAKAAPPKPDTDADGQHDRPTLRRA